MILMDLMDNVELSRTNKMIETTQKASYVRGHKSTINREELFARVNKTFNKRKNRALLTFRRLQKHYEIFSDNVLRKNITRKQFRVNLVPRVSHLTAPLARPRGR